MMNPSSARFILTEIHLLCVPRLGLSPNCGRGDDFILTENHLLCVPTPRRQVRRSNKQIASKVLGARGALGLLRAAGFVPEVRRHSSRAPLAMHECVQLAQLGKLGATDSLRY
jgi:hypothetical protein